MRNLSRNSRYFLLIVGVGLLVLMVLGFNKRISVLRQLEEEAEVVSADVTRLESTYAVLETQIAYATSDAAVEEWAYEEGRMKRDGEFPVAPLSPGQSTPEPVQIIVPTPEPVENWQVWKALFFDQALP